MSKNISVQDHKTKKAGFKITTADMAVIALSTALIAVCSWISVPTVVPFTLQTFAVFAVAGLFGMKRATLSMVVYILLGAIGVPVLAGMQGGFDKIIGSTGGYIIGFLLIAMIVGFASDTFGRKAVPLSVSMLVGLAVCYIFGTAWFMFVYSRTSGPIALGAALAWCVLPYLIPDAVKIVLAAFLTGRLTPILRKD